MKLYALDVYLRGVKAGRMEGRAAARMRFTYDTEFPARPGAIPLSISLPFGPESFDEARTRPFFAGLLPEGVVREALARRLGLSQTNELGLLEAIGGECAGAVAVVPAGDDAPAHGGYEALDEERLHDLVGRLPSRPLLAGEGALRLSLAGAQHKLPVFLDNETVSLPKGDAPSTHILKVPIRDVPETVENEAFCMALARECGLLVPDAFARRVRGKSVYFVRRYDRAVGSSGRIERLHQEDLCQALGIPPELKYEQEGGPSLASCVELLRGHSVQPAIDVRALIAWTAFNHLIGNADAHGKNIALLLLGSGPRLAPFYDLLCTEIYPGLTERHAMAIGGEKRPEWRMDRHWKRLADELLVGSALVRRLVSEMAKRVRAAAPALAKRHDAGIVGKVVELAVRRAEQTLERLGV